MNDTGGSLEEVTMVPAVSGGCGGSRPERRSLCRVAVVQRRSDYAPLRLIRGRIHAAALGVGLAGRRGQLARPSSGLIPSRPPTPAQAYGELGGWAVIRSLRGARGPGDTPLVSAWTGPSIVRARPESPVLVTAQLLEQLRHLTADPDRTDALAAALAELCVDVEVAVPSWMSVSIVLTSAKDVDIEANIEVALVAPGGKDGEQAFSSLAVALSEVDPGDQLVVRAGGAGAFLLLADDLASRPGRARLIVVDRHLDPPPDGEEAAAMVAGLAVVDQAIGVLLDRELSPPQAREDLECRARAAGVSLADAARSLLQTVPGPRDAAPRGQ